MSTHLSQLTVDGYRQRTLSSAQRLSVHAHISSCDACRNYLNRRLKDKELSNVSLLGALDELDDLLAAEGEGVGHLTYDQVASLIDNKARAADLVILRKHLETCSDCEDRVKSLIRAKEELDNYKLGAKSSRWEGFISIWRLPKYRLVPLTAGVAGVIVGAVLVVLIRPNSDLLARLTELKRQNEVLHRQTSGAGGLQEQVDNLKRERDELEQRNQELQQAGQSAQATNEALKARLASLESPPKGKGASPPGSPTHPRGPSPSSPEFALNDGGGRIGLDSRGNLSGLEGVPPEHQRVVRAVLERQSVKEIVSVDRRLVERANVLRGEPKNGLPFPLVGPLGTVVRDQQPTLRWEPLAGARSYTVKIVTADGSNDKVADSGKLAGTEWTATKPLTRGKTYYWEVEAEVADGSLVVSPVVPAPDAKFRVLDSAAADELERAEREQASSHLLLGSLYAKAGLLDDAEREFRLLARANPKSPAVRRLLESVRRLKERGK